MKFEWDDKKNLINLEKHGILFEEAALIFKSIVLTMIDNKKSYGEDRKISIGRIENIIFIVVVHTCRDERIRIISARRANKKERDKYYEYTKNIK